MMRTVEISEMDKYFEACPRNINIMMVGDTGIGKTTIVTNYCNKHNKCLKTLILSQLDAADALNIPTKSTIEFRGKTYSTIESAIPKWVFELAEEKDPVLFLDEFLCAQPSVMNAFLNFLSEKKVQDIDLSHVQIIAATNIGNYTFDPDANILSRFCWFYTENTKMNEYNNDERVINSYVDDNDKTGPVFEIRQLRPRCQTWLKNVPDNFLSAFYEGFTNKQYFFVHRDPIFNEICGPYFKSTERGIYEISESDITNLVAVLKSKFPRFRTWENTIAGFINVEAKDIIEIKKGLKNKNVKAGD